MHPWVIWSVSTFLVTAVTLVLLDSTLRRFGVPEMVIYSFSGCLATELVWWSTNLSFDWLKAQLAPFKIRGAEQAGIEELKAGARQQRIAGYWLEPVVYAGFFTLGKLDYGQTSLMYNSLGLFLMLLWLDIGFWLWHYLLHLPGWYKYHKHHHSVHITDGWTNDLEHPVETLGNMGIKQLGVVAVSSVLRVHPAAAFAYFAFTKWYGVTNHSGYNPPPFDWMSHVPSVWWWVATPLYHEDHHFSNSGKLGVLTTVWDEIYQKCVKRPEARVGKPRWTSSRWSRRRSSECRLAHASH